MTETQRRIKEYQNMLPGLRERVMAVAMLLVVSLTMVVSASFAWITLSRAPEVSMMSTTVAANGNLEIALVDDDGLEPDEVAIGDSSSTDGQKLVDANITWGNLVNLSDSIYGLNQIDLRPALLSGYNLNTTPLYGATYSVDGRVQDVSATYQYASWTEAEDGTWYFAAGDDATYGVRAISSVKYENITGNAAISTLMTKARNAYAATNSMYLNLINGTTMVDETRNISAMDGLAMLLEIFVNEKAESAMKSGGDVYKDYKSVVTYTYRLLLEYQKILDSEGEALLLLANLQVYANNSERGTEYFKSVDELKAASAATLKNLGVSLESLTTYKANCTSIQSAINGMEPFAIAYDPDTGTATDPVYWPDTIVVDDVKVSVDGIGKHVSKLVDVNTTTANGVPMNQITISNALSVIKDPLKVVINKGVLKDTEQRLGDMLKTNNTTVTIYISAMSLGNKTAYVSTSAEAPFLANNDMGTSSSMEATGAGNAISLDTYGLAIDLWVRTNAQDSVLILEGSTEYEEVEATCTDKNGNVAALYVADGEEKDYDVYFLEETDTAGNTVTNVYDMVSHIAIGTQTEMMEEGYTFTRKYNRVVAGYEGEYRVWKDLDELLNDELIAENSTTQGSGSCYVFYANPSDQTRILELLEAFTIAFLDQNGTHIATAKLDTENYYAINGKVTVPMIITSGVSYVDSEGEEQMAIRTLPRNTATWLTAVIYLDGMQLTNENVLAAGEIEGRLNIQFGSSNLMDPMDNLELQQKYRIVSASVTGGGSTSTGEVDQDGNILDAITFSYDGTAKQVTATLTVEGDQPSNVSGFFIRSIGANQGTRTDTEVFTRNEDDTWSATFDLLKPGNYSLRSVIVDGVEYTLDKTPSVYIDGLAVTRINCDPESGIVMTADSYVDVNVNVEINADADLMPSQVRALYRGTDGREFTAVMSYNSEDDTWSGTARITASGTYTLTYLVMDGDYTELSESQQKTLIVTLGMKSSVQCTGILDNEDARVESTAFTFKKGPYDIAMRAEIFDDAGNEIENLENVWLQYWLDGGTVDQDGMGTALTWDAATGYYTGNLEMINAGTYYFDRIVVTISGNKSNIRTATSAPLFEATPPEPPAVDLSSNATAAYQFAPAGDATMSVNLRYAQTADMWALFENVYTGQQTLVKSGSKIMLEDPVNTGGTDYYQFNFKVPLNDRNTVGSDGYESKNSYQNNQDGAWVIKEVWLQKVFDENSNFYGSVVNETTGLPVAADCMVFDVYDENKSAEDNIYSYVIQALHADLSGTYTNDAGVFAGNITDETESVVFGKSGNTITGDFMDSYTASALTWAIYDWQNKPIDGMTASWELNFDGGSVSNGGYSGATAFKIGETLTAASDGITYTIPSQTYQEAGNYVMTLTYSAGTYTRTIKCTYSVYSIKPVLSIDDISPKGSHKTVNSSNATTTVTSKIDGNTITIYPNSEVTGSGCNKSGKLNEEPKVYLKLANRGNATTATLTFTESSGGEVRLYYGSSSKSGTQTNAWTWNSTDADVVMRFIGYNDAGSCDSSVTAGTLTSATTVVLTYGTGDSAKSYTVTVDAITIINNRP